MKSKKFADFKMNDQLLQKITSKKEYSQLPMKDVELTFSHFEKREVSDEEKIRLTRELLHKVFGAFTSQKLLSLKEKTPEWMLRKHLSTRERLSHYQEIYKRVLKGFDRDVSIIDLGAGINGFSYKYFPKKVNYLAIEAMGQLVDLMNNYFDTLKGMSKEKLNAKAVHLSLFELSEIKGLIKKVIGNKIIFLFKVIDNLEMLEKDYSKKLLLGVGDLAERIVVSFATRSMGSGVRFRAKRDWIIKFIKDNFKVMDDFEIGGERYLVFNK
jgi:hypothetical protein